MRTTGLWTFCGAGLIAGALLVGAPTGWADPAGAAGGDPGASRSTDTASGADRSTTDSGVRKQPGPTEDKTTAPAAVRAARGTSTTPRTVRTAATGLRANHAARQADRKGPRTVRKPAAPEAVIEAPPSAAPEPIAHPEPQPVARVAAIDRATVEVAPAATAPAAAAVESARTVARAPSLLHAVGSALLDALTGLIHLIDGPPMLPAGSSVTVRTASLTVPIGSGRSVQADWYFPKDYSGDVDESARLIYLQHGFLASGPMYSYTAANLAERTNSVVVAPSLSSNFLNVNAEWVGGSTMQRAMADLFQGDRAALNESASAAAGFQVTLPRRFALVGHSAGGTMVTTVAGHLAGTAAFDNLAGVVTLDGVEPAGSGAVGEALAKLTGAQDIPIYLISSQRYMWSRDGDMADKLMAARPDRFNGVALTDGMHIDYMEGGNRLLQFAEYLVSGFSHQENIDAAGLITAGWVNDLFEGTTRNGLYGAPLERISVDTRTGAATAVVLPLGPAGRSPLGPILDPVLSGLLTFAGRHLFVYDPLV